MTTFPFTLMGESHGSAAKVGDRVQVEIHTPTATVIVELERAEAMGIGEALLAACHRKLWPGA